ncbi:MAG TPA: DUF4105 domain-containing protein, partial [Myxococcaceae bacterium]|nr:DUF4105 domain-containing protein [Myxococcaceae bacterium]
QYFGHSALWVEDTRLGADALYGYGMSSFGRGAALSFLVKRPTFWAGRVHVQSAFFLYRELDRSISVQELHLTVEQRRRLFARLERDVRPEHREYRYHPTEDNCATRVRDVLDEALGGALRSELPGPARFSQREHLRRYTRRSPLMDLLLLVWLDSDVDAPMTRWQEVFLPRELSRVLEEATVPDGAGGHVRLVSRRYDEHLSAAAPLPEPPAPTQGSAFLIGAAVAAGAVLLAALRGERRWARVLFGLYHALFGLTLGTVGLAAFLLMLFSEHAALGSGENLLLVNPLTFALLPLGLGMALGHRGAERWSRGCVAVLVLGSLLAVALDALPAFNQDNRVPMSLLLVANLGLGAAHGLPWRRAAGVPVPPPPGPSARRVVRQTR